jgi:glutaminase
MKKLDIHPKDIRFLNNNKCNIFQDKYDNGCLQVSNFDKLKKIITDIYNEIKLDNSGEVADYIPQLKNVNSELFGIAFVSIDGQVLEIGDTDSKFCVQSCSKPITYGIVLNEYNDEIVHNFVGKEPSGRNFNELCLNEDGLPHNPLINSGAIMTTSLIKPNLSLSERFDFVYSYWKKLTCNTHLSFNNSVYLSEKDSADRNYCLGYMMQEKNAFINGKNSDISKKINRKWQIGNLQQTLELYFQFCSIESDLLGMSLLSSTLANGGINPWSYQEIFKSNTVKKILSIMGTCGMYDFSGEWYYQIGIPGKSGVSGLIYAVIPGIGGIATYSPKLDKIGNSHRGINFFKELSKRINIHKYENPKNPDLLSIRKLDNNNIKILGFLLLEGCYNGDIELVKESLSKGCDINFQDYDKRTALHIATEENRTDIIELLIDNGAKCLEDRWGNKPIISN